MLPSFRLIAATFLCGFFVVFVGLRMAASLNDIHEGLPVMAAHAAPMTVAPAADRDARRGASSVPVMYDLRFAVAPVSPILVRAAPTLIERPLPPLPLAILPPDIPPKRPAEPAAQPEATVAAIDRDADVAPAPSAVPEPPSDDREPSRCRHSNPQPRRRPNSAQAPRPRRSNRRPRRAGCDTSRAAGGGARNVG